MVPINECLHARNCLVLKSCINLYYYKFRKNKILNQKAFILHLILFFLSIFSTSKDNPIHLFDAYTGTVRCSYQGYNHLVSVR